MYDIHTVNMMYILYCNVMLIYCEQEYCHTSVSIN